MRFDTVIMGGGLAGMIAGIALQQAGKNTAIVSMGQNALHFFSGTFESLKEPDERLAALFSAAGIRVHYREGVRLMPLGTFKKAALSLEDIDIFPNAKIARRVLIVNFLGYHDFFSSFLAEGLEKHGIECRIRFLSLPDLDNTKAHGEMRSVQIARSMDRIWEKVVQEIRLMLRDEDTVVLPQVFGLSDTTVPGRIRQSLPARVVFAGTMPPSVPGIRTQIQLRRRYQLLGGTFLMGDEANRHQQSGCALFRGRFLHPGHRRTVLQGPPVQSVPDFGAHPGPGCRPSGRPQQLVQSGLCGGTAVHGLWRKNGCAAACC